MADLLSSSLSRHGGRREKSPGKWPCPFWPELQRTELDRGAFGIRTIGRPLVSVVAVFRLFCSVAIAVILFRRCSFFVVGLCFLVFNQDDLGGVDFRK